MQRLLILIFITIATVSTVSCQSEKSKNKKEQFDPVKLEEITQQGQFKTLWTRKLDSDDKSYGYKLIPYIDSKDVYVASQTGEVIKLNAETGVESWSINLELELSAGPGVGSSILMVGTPEGKVIALDKDNGNQLWTVNMSSEILTPPVINNQLAIVRAQDGRVYALDTTTGERKWLFDTNIPNLTLRGNSQPVVKADVTPDADPITG